MDHFTFNGKHSLDDIGIFARVVSSPLFSDVKTISEDLPGADGEIDLSVDNIKGRRCLKPRLIEVECDFSSTDNPTVEGYNEKLKSICNWLFTDKEKALKFDSDNSFYYLGIPLTPINVEKITDYSGRFTVVFKCQPFKYSMEPQILNPEYYGKIDILNNGYYTGAQFVFSATFTDYIAFIYKDKRLQINTDLYYGEFICVDTEKMTVTRDGISILHLCEGDFFEIEPGESAIYTEIEGDIGTLTLDLILTEKYL